MRQAHPGLCHPDDVRDPPADPPRHPTLVQRFALWLLHVFGWKTRFVWPPERKGIIAVYPHTSNWDFPLGLLFRIGHGLPANWIGKREMFPWPIGPLFEAIGGIPLDRSRTTGFLDAIMAEYRRRNWMWIAIAVEGTRGYTDHLKPGFWVLATQLDIPVGLGCIDYATKTVSIDTYVRFSGDRERDMQVLRDYFAGKRGLKPEFEGEIRLRP